MSLEITFFEKLMWHFFLFFFHFVVVKTSSRQLYSVLAGTLTTPFLFLCVFWRISPNRRTLGRYVKGALPILYVLMFPWKYSFSISIGKKWGNEKRVVYVRGVTCPSRWTLRCGGSNHHRAAFTAISIMSLSVGFEFDSQFDKLTKLHRCQRVKVWGRGPKALASVH